MKALLILLTVAALSGGGWWWFHRGGSDAPQYQTSPVTRGELTQIVTATGTLNPVVNVQVGSQISGNILKLTVDFNSPVKAGQMVAQLDPAIYQAIVHQMEGDLASSKAALELTRLTAARKKELVAQHAAAQADLDTALANLHQAEATVQVKQANLEKAQVDLEHCNIYSPIDGTVISRAVDVGQTVAAAMNAPIIFTIANDLSKMQIDSNVAEADVGNVEVGQTVDFSVDAFPYRTFHGTVSQVRNAALTTQNVVTYDVVVSVDNSELKLKPGMTANVSVVIAHRDDVVRLPNSALRFRPPDLPGSPSPTPSAIPPGGEGKPGGRHKKSGDGPRAEKSVYMLDGTGKLQPVKAKLGISDGITTEVLDGLKEGDQVVTSVTLSQSAASSAQRPSNPLGGGMRLR